MGKMTKEQMREYQRDRRKRLKEDGAKARKLRLIEPPVTGVTVDVMAEVSVWVEVRALQEAFLVLEDAVRVLEHAVAALQAEVALLKVVEETFKAGNMAAAVDKTLFRRVVAEKERRLGG